jgi:hypothetical protein
MSSKEIYAEAKIEGFKERTLANARKELGVKCYSEKDDEGNKRWFWKLPNKDSKSNLPPALQR